MIFSNEKTTCVVVAVSEQSHFKVCFWPFGFINNPALWKCFFLSRTVNKSVSEKSTKLESKTDDLKREFSL